MSCKLEVPWTLGTLTKGYTGNLPGIQCLCIRDANLCKSGFYISWDKTVPPYFEYWLVFAFFIFVIHFLHSCLVIFVCIFPLFISHNCKHSLFLKILSFRNSNSTFLNLAFNFMHQGLGQYLNNRYFSYLLNNCSKVSVVSPAICNILGPGACQFSLLLIHFHHQETM